MTMLNKAEIISLNLHPSSCADMSKKKKKLIKNIFIYKMELYHTCMLMHGDDRNFSTILYHIKIMPIFS